MRRNSTGAGSSSSTVKVTGLASSNFETQYEESKPSTARAAPCAESSSWRWRLNWQQGLRYQERHRFDSSTCMLLEPNLICPFPCSSQAVLASGPSHDASATPAPAATPLGTAKHFFDAKLVKAPPALQAPDLSPVQLCNCCTAIA